MLGRIPYLLLIALATTVAAGCASTPARFYTLDSTASADGAPTASYAVSVGPVSVPSAVARPQFVLQAGPNRLDVDEFNRWATPLDEAIARAVAGNLTVLLGTPHVAIAPLANFDPAYRVTIGIQQFDSELGKGVFIDTLWVVRAATGGPARTGRTSTRETVADDSFDALAAAHSRALAKVSRDIAVAVDAIAAAKTK